MAKLDRTTIGKYFLKHLFSGFHLQNTYDCIVVDEAPSSNGTTKKTNRQQQPANRKLIGERGDGLERDKRINIKT